MKLELETQKSGIILYHTDPKKGLIVIVKRCQWNQESKRSIKTHRRISFNGQLKILAQNGQLAKYQLTAAIQHIGEVEYGHYIAHLNNGNQHFTVNDYKLVTVTQQFESEISQIFVYQDVNF